VKPNGLGCWPFTTIGTDTIGSSAGASPSYGGEQQQVGMGKDIALCLTNGPFSGSSEVGEILYPSLYIDPLLCREILVTQTELHIV
jgi:hypothetical protein